MRRQCLKGGSGPGSWLTGAIDEAIRWNNNPNEQRKCHVINMSLGSPYAHSYPPNACGTNNNCE